jgi:hypothetical protein
VFFFLLETLRRGAGKEECLLEKDLMPARALNGGMRAASSSCLVACFLTFLLVCMADRKTKSLPLIFTCLISRRLLLSDHQADRRRMAVAFSWSADMSMFFGVDFKQAVQGFPALLRMIDGGEMMRLRYRE